MNQVMGAVASVLAPYYATINVVTFILFCVDKSRAVHHEWRIPEATLLGASLAGGALGGLLAMRIAHHKTRKPRFCLGLPAMLALHVALLAWLLLRAES